MKKRFLPFALALALSLGLMIPTALAAAEDSSSSYVQVTVSALNVRSGPTAKHSVIGAVYQGNVLEIVETQTYPGGYSWGKLTNGGWIYLEYTKAASADAAATTPEAPAESTPAETTPAETTTPESGDSYSVQVTVSALNVRSGPTAKYSVIGAVYQGNVLEIVETQTYPGGYSWGKLSTGGWIYLEYTKAATASEAPAETPAETPTETPAETPDASGTSVQVTVSALNVRSGPGASYGVISAVRQGDVLTIVETKTYTGGYSWGKLSTGGWIYLAYAKAV